MPAREPGSSKGPRRSETAQAVTSAGQFMSGREPGSIKGPRRSKSAQAASTAVRVVHVRNTRVEQRVEACEDYTSCINGGTVSARQEHTGRVKARGVPRLHKLHQWRYE